MTFKRMMALGAMAAALAFTGCQDRSRSEQDLGTRGAEEQTPPATGTGGAGRTDESTIPGSSDTIGGTPQDARPGTELGGTGAEGSGGSGGAGGDVGTSGDLDQDQRNQLEDQDDLGGSEEEAR